MLKGFDTILGELAELRFQAGDQFTAIGPECVLLRKKIAFYFKGALEVLQCFCVPIAGSQHLCVFDQ